MRRKLSRGLLVSAAKLIEIEAHINDPAFAHTALEVFDS
jgi:uncharacterized protein (UPF0261 family)